jgi:hypothetical protein
MPVAFIGREAMVKNKLNRPWLAPRLPITAVPIWRHRWLGRRAAPTAIHFAYHTHGP